MKNKQLLKAKTLLPSLGPKFFSGPIIIILIIITTTTSITSGAAKTCGTPLRHVTYFVSSNPQTFQREARIPILQIWSEAWSSETSRTTQLQVAKPETRPSSLTPEGVLPLHPANPPLSWGDLQAFTLDCDAEVGNSPAPCWVASRCCQANVLRCPPPPPDKVELQLTLAFSSQPADCAQKPCSRVWDPKAVAVQPCWRVTWQKIIFKRPLLASYIISDQNSLNWWCSHMGQLEVV